MAQVNPTLRLTRADRSNVISQLSMIDSLLRNADCKFTAIINAKSAHLRFIPFLGPKTIPDLSALEHDILREYLSKAGFIVSTDYDADSRRYSLEISCPDG